MRSPGRPHAGIIRSVGASGGRTCTSVLTGADVCAPLFTTSVTV